VSAFPIQWGILVNPCKFSSTQSLYLRKRPMNYRNLVDNRERHKICRLNSSGQHCRVDLPLPERGWRPAIKTGRQSWSVSCVGQETRKVNASIIVAIAAEPIPCRIFCQFGSIEDNTNRTASSSERSPARNDCRSSSPLP
jgi:hypothetical protein